MNSLVPRDGTWASHTLVRRRGHSQHSFPSTTKQQELDGGSMRRLGILLLLFALLEVSTASAKEWRWAPPHSKHKATYSYTSLTALKQTYLKERRRYLRWVKRYNQRRLREWKHWTKLYIPACTWYGESGTGPQFALIRYIMPNSQGSGAYGKYQMMPRTYHSDAKYHDWSPLDQEIAGHREYWRNGTSPWANC